jgi:toxin ParE1/3/4
LAATELGEAALHYPLVPGRPEAGVRRRVVDSYNIYFTVMDEAVTVVLILHGARDVDARLFGPNDA